VKAPGDGLQLFATSESRSKANVMLKDRNDRSFHTNTITMGLWY
jgi:hypothetical protein